MGLGKPPAISRTDVVPRRVKAEAVHLLAGGERGGGEGSESWVARQQGVEGAWTREAGLGPCHAHHLRFVKDLVRQRVLATRARFQIVLRLHHLIIQIQRPPPGGRRDGRHGGR